MKTLIFILITAIVITSCKSAKQKEQDSLQDNLRTFYVANLVDSSVKVDSFRILKMDTITDFARLSRQRVLLSMYVEGLLEAFGKNNKLLSNAVDQLKLYTMLNSQTLVDVQKNNVKEQTDKGHLINAEIDTVNKVISAIIHKMESADTLKPIGFQVTSFVQLRAIDKSVKNDTSFILLNAQKEIVKHEDFLKLPYKIEDKF